MWSIRDRIVIGVILIGYLLATPASADESMEQFCSEAQKIIVDSPLQARNDIYDDFDAFTKSKPSIDPLVTTQYVWPQRSAQGEAVQISCKMKTADHLQAIHGPEAAGSDRGCAGVNRQTVNQVLKAMTDAERSRLRWIPEQTLVFAEDIVTAQGPLWLEPYAMVREDQGRLVIQAKGMKNDWTDPRYAAAPPQFRGTRYCHLVTPAYLRALLLGEAVTAW